MPSIDGRQYDRNGRSLISDSGQTMINAPVCESFMPSTIRDIARLAGVSTATVSRVANGTKHVSCEIRTKVLSAISRLKYSPNAHAVQLAQANRGIPRKSKSRLPALAGRGTELHSASGANKQNKERKVELRPGIAR